MKTPNAEIENILKNEQGTDINNIDNNDFTNEHESVYKQMGYINFNDSKVLIDSERSLSNCNTDYSTFGSGDLFSQKPFMALQNNSDEMMTVTGPIKNDDKKLINLEEILGLGGSDVSRAQKKVEGPNQFINDLFSNNENKNSDIFNGILFDQPNSNNGTSYNNSISYNNTQPYKSSPINYNQQELKITNPMNNSINNLNNQMNGINSQMNNQMNSINNLNNLNNQMNNPMNSQMNSINNLNSQINNINNQFNNLNNLNSQMSIGSSYQNINRQHPFNRYYNTRRENFQRPFINTPDRLLFRNPVLQQNNFNPLAYNKIKRRRRAGTNLWYTSSNILPFHPSKLSSLEFVHGGISATPKLTNLGMASGQTSEYLKIVEKFKRQIRNLDFDNITVHELKNIMKDYGLNPNGKKKEMIDRIINTLKDLGIKGEENNNTSQALETKKDSSYDRYFF